MLCHPKQSIATVRGRYWIANTLNFACQGVKWQEGDFSRLTCFFSIYESQGTQPTAFNNWGGVVNFLEQLTLNILSCNNNVVPP